MLGKTNLTTVEKGTVVSDVADYSWNDTGISGITGNFVKAIYENNVLVGITKEGMIAYTKDGEIWETTKLDLQDDYELNDILWDGTRYVIAGSHTDNRYIYGLIVLSEDLVNYDVRQQVNKKSYFNISSNYVRFLGVTLKDGKYIIIYVYFQPGSGGSADNIYYQAGVTDLETYANRYSITTSYCMNKTGFNEISSVESRLSKSSQYLILYVKDFSLHRIFISSNGTSYKLLVQKDGTTADDWLSVFECKDSLYYFSTHKNDNYNLVKINGTSEILIISTGINYGFVDAVYFNKCIVYINKHEMLIIKSNENVADKTLDDLVEITYDFSMTAIVKAFNKLYIFGTGGKVLVSSDENNNREAIAVKAMSAAKALYEAKLYTDKKYNEMQGSDEYVRQEDLAELGNQAIEDIWNSVFRDSEDEESEKGGET